MGRCEAGGFVALMALPPTRQDALEVTKARLEYGEALRELRALQKEAQESGGGERGDLRRRIGAAEDRVACAAARLLALEKQPYFHPQPRGISQGNVSLGRMRARSRS
jgi:hypothetical protein